MIILKLSKCGNTRGVDFNITDLVDLIQVAFSFVWEVPISILYPNFNYKTTRSIHSSARSRRHQVSRAKVFSWGWPGIDTGVKSTDLAGSQSCLIPLSENYFIKACPG